MPRLTPLRTNTQGSQGERKGGGGTHIWKLEKAASRQEIKTKKRAIHTDTYMRFGEITDTSSSYFQENRLCMYTEQDGYGKVPGWCTVGYLSLV